MREERLHPARVAARSLWTRRPLGSELKLLLQKPKCQCGDPKQEAKMMNAKEYNGPGENSIPSFHYYELEAPPQITDNTKLVHFSVLFGKFKFIRAWGRAWK